MTDYPRFEQTVWQYYEEFGRHDMPWRQPKADGSFDAYTIWVSEIMLQQTQVQRVIPKFLAFIKHFPTITDLAQAPLADVLQLWIGLGYNRRAKFLSVAAQQIEANHDGKMPSTLDELIALPGIGKNTAGAIMAYAYNHPVVFIETNIRTVFIHHFFADAEEIEDTSLLSIIAETLSQENPREWYWALMDYGSHLKLSVGNSSQKSKHYTKQSTFKGSRRQIRGAVLRALAETAQTSQQLTKSISDDRLASVLQDLVNEGFVVDNEGLYQLTS